MATNLRKERIDRGIKARTDDIFALNGVKEALYLLGPRVIPVLIILILPLVLPAYWNKVFVVACMMAIMSLSWDFIHSAGMISLGQSLFFGIGAYLTGILNQYFGISAIITIPLAAVLGGMLSTIILTPVLRLRGIYFGMVTFALSLMAFRIIEATGVFEGTEGISGLSPFANQWVEVYVAAIAMIVCLFGFRRLINTDYGIVLRGINENDRGVLRSGINITWFKMQALFIGSAACCFAGAFMAHFTRVAGVAAFGLDNSIMPVACVIVGGIGTFAGPVVGAFILTPISEVLRALGGWRIVFYCLIMAVFIVAYPSGVFDFIRRRYHQYERMVQTEGKK